MDTQTKKVTIPKGFFTNKGVPTMNTIMCYYLFFSNGGKKTDTEISDDVVEKIREFFGWGYDTGFSTILKWGLSDKCSNSTTSNERFRGMRDGLIKAHQMFMTTSQPPAYRLDHC